jgi:hypothetical protein
MGVERSKAGESQLCPIMLPQPTRRNTIQEDPKSTLYFAHLFFADHVLSTSWTIFFAVVWWLYSPHDGRRVSNSAAQDQIIKNYLGETEKVSEDERARLALQLWGREKGVAIAIIVLGWLIKVCGQFTRHTIPSFDSRLCSSILQRQFTLTRFT